MYKEGKEREKLEYKKTQMLLKNIASTSNNKHDNSTFGGRKCKRKQKKRKRNLIKYLALGSSE